MRKASAVASRLASLGALQGDRRAGGAEAIRLAEYDLSSRLAVDALRKVLRGVFSSSRVLSFGQPSSLAVAVDMALLHARDALTRLDFTYEEACNQKKASNLSFRFLNRTPNEIEPQPHALYVCYC